MQTIEDMETICRSYSAMAFDGCPACSAAALDAVAQAGIYLLGRTAPDLAGEAAGPLDRSYSLRLRLRDQSGEEIASDEMDVSQTIAAIPIASEADVSLDDRVDEAPDAAEDDAAMKLEDFQTVVERLELETSGQGGIEGIIAGELYGFDRFIGSFEILVAPGS